MANPNILDAALTLFSQQGFEGTTIKEIATKAGLKPSSIYSHYESKEEIFLYLLQTCIENTIKSVLPLKAKVERKIEIDPQKILYTYYETVVNHFINHKEEYLFLKQATFFGENHKLSQGNMIDLFGEEAFDYFASFFKELQEQKRVRTYNHQALAFAYLGIIIAYLEEKLVYMIPLHNDYIEKSWEIFWNGIKN